MIKKVSQNNWSEVEFELQKIAQEKPVPRSTPNPPRRKKRTKPVAPREPEATTKVEKPVENISEWAAAAKKSASGNNVDLSEVKSLAEPAANTLSKSIPKLEAAGLKPEEIFEALKIGAEIPGAVSGKVSDPDMAEQILQQGFNISAIKKFSKKLNSFKTDDEKFEFLKKSKVIDEVELIKLGNRLDRIEIKKYAQEQSFLGTAEGDRSLTRSTLGAGAKWLAGKMPGSGALGMAGRALGFIGKVVPLLPAIIETIKAIAALIKALYAFGSIVSNASEVGLSWYQPIVSAKYMEDKITDYENDPNKMGTLGYVTNAGKSFWQNIVDGILSGLAAVANYLWITVSSAAAAAAAGATAFTGPAAPFIGGVVGFLVSAIGGLAIDWIKSFLSNMVGGWMTKKYVEVSEKIDTILNDKAKPKSRYSLRSRLAA